MFWVPNGVHYFYSSVPTNNSMRTKSGWLLCFGIWWQNLCNRVEHKICKPFGREQKWDFCELRASENRIWKALAELHCQELSRHPGTLTRGSGSGDIWSGLRYSGKEDLCGWWPHHRYMLQLCQWGLLEWLFKEYMCLEEMSHSNVYSTWGGEPVRSPGGRLWIGQKLRQPQVPGAIGQPGV